MTDFVEVGLPDKMHIDRTYDSLTITRKWFGFDTILITAFAIIWNIFIISFDSLPLLHAFAGVCISYIALTRWLNKTTIKISKHRIEIKHSPLPWFNNKKLNALDIKQVYGKKKLSRNTLASNTNSTISSVSYEVHIITHRGQDTKILCDLSTSEQALYIEQEIEKYLNIKNQPVQGELG